MFHIEVPRRICEVIICIEVTMTLYTVPMWSICGVEKFATQKKNKNNTRRLNHREVHSSTYVEVFRDFADQEVHNCYFYF